MSERQKQRPAAPDAGGSVAPNRLVLLVTVVQKGKGTFFADFLKNYDANLQICLVGTGTAQANLVEFLGLKDNKRSVIFSVVRDDRVDDIFAAVEQVRAAGYPIDIEPNQGADFNWQAWVTDPNGIRIELMKIEPQSPQAQFR